MECAVYLNAMHAEKLALKELTEMSVIDDLYSGDEHNANANMPPHTLT